MSRGADTPKPETQKSRAGAWSRLGAKPSGRNIQAPPPREYKPRTDGPTIPDPTAILDGETFRSRKPSDWKRGRRRKD
ncbi:hypothetical protein [Mycolicibacterium thermoresistibile]|uniref:Mlr0812 protein n=1 Tax=Mycolicibacterium thermoresistibile TaxID=1797 RepID=A0A117IND4_MYCTH|nr:hypothetical protein [Mycolicibacterium thermoresistibile]MCV7188816.1 hypothetical protein [Mycolicibacterium thermoresistibile]GAT16646.1 Mlr0812 protein [Mycolicibacterium thermoresistibile]SNW18706.1 Uncharacterised protein [Mycolicibacterium thermoresistibile]